ncbi:hypothetical protein ARMSODRAFT_1022369 [Armillaria solidipes]|uniref:Uncharacterized protein n=1 Tax=Armillaria solidipes TaxID=1076256 RepID=A0A2H3BDY3_9AGAR|nr:hypothetical protein ARMSODRAFT_1022369 [Armillaria solidipes]
MASHEDKVQELFGEWRGVNMEACSTTGGDSLRIKKSELRETLKECKQPHPSPPRLSLKPPPSHYLTPLRFPPPTFAFIQVNQSPSIQPFALFHGGHSGALNFRRETLAA